MYHGRLVRQRSSVKCVTEWRVQRVGTANLVAGFALQVASEDTLKIHVSHFYKSGGVLYIRVSNNNDKNNATTPMALEPPAHRKNRRPLECHFCPERQHFLVTHSRGSTLHRGGYGYVLSSSVALDEDHAAVGTKDLVVKCEKTVATAHHYLFIEEVLFLFEQGLLHAFREGAADGVLSPSPAAAAEEAPLSRFELFELLERAGVALPTYLVYQHLRAQTFRVVRHTPTRRAILVQQIALQNPEANTSHEHSADDNALEESLVVFESVSDHGNVTLDAANPSHQRPVQALKRQLRCDTRQALPPVPGAIIAWDGYHPTASFSAAAPGLPDFYVAIAYMTNTDGNDGTFSYRDLQSLLRQTIVPRVPTNEEEEEEVYHPTNVEETRIPLKIATVSDSGTVLLFGITDFGVPMNHHPLPPTHDGVPNNA
jgi:hypothetical protein